MATLTERYVAAVTRHVPGSQRPDVEREVSAAISEIIAARQDDRATADRPAQESERAALLELGDPVRLAADYTDRPLQLIGPAVYPAYIGLLSVLLTTVLPIILAAVALATLFASGDPGKTVANTMLTGISVFGHMFFWTTLLFVVIERSTAAGAHTPLPGWTPERLPDVRIAGEARLGDTVAAVVLSLGTILYLVWQQFRSPFAYADGSPVPLLNPALWDSWLPFFIALLLAAAALEWHRYRVRRWNRGILAAHILVHTALAVPLLVLLANGSLVNGDFLARIGSWWPDAPSGIKVVGMVSIAGIWIWDLLDTGLKARRDARGAGRGHSMEQPPGR